MFVTREIASSWLKVHKHEIILNFFLPKSNPYMPLANLLIFLLFSPEFRSLNIFASIRGTKFFGEISQKFFFIKMFNWDQLDGFPNGFSNLNFFVVEMHILSWDF